MFKKGSILTMTLGAAIFVLGLIKDGCDQALQEEENRKIAREEIEAYFAEKENKEEEA